MQAQLGDDFPAFIKAQDAVPPVSIHLNPLKDSGPPADGERVPWYERGWYLPHRPVFTLDPAFHAGAYYVQEASSMLIAEAVRQLTPAGQPLKVLDLCGAPGGKSTLLAAILPPGSLLVANEVIKSRYQTLRYNLIKWGHIHVFSTQADSRQFAPLRDYFDLVVTDAPCSGEGLFRRDPAAAAEWSPAHVDFCAARQQRILADAVPLLRPGGLLLYSTCTYNRTENDANAQWLQAAFGLAPERLQFPDHWGMVAAAAGYQCYPHRVRGEGFYLAALRRPAGQVAAPPPPPPDRFKHWTELHKKDAALAQRWLQPSADWRFFSDRSGQWWALPAPLVAEALQLSRALGRVDMGVPIGQLKGSDIVPAPELALHSLAAPPVPALAVDRETALQLLRKETPDLGAALRGWQWVQYQGLGLLWVKGVGHRYNNYYPAGWRIRMSISDNAPPAT